MYLDSDLFQKAEVSNVWNYFSQVSNFIFGDIQIRQVGKTMFKSLERSEVVVAQIKNQ